MSDPFETFGPRELCTWSCGEGVSCLQTTSPVFARKLSQRSCTTLVAWSVNKRYLRVFQEKIEPWRARRLVSRYVKPTNGVFLDDLGRQMVEKSDGRVVYAAKTRELFLGQLGSQNSKTKGYDDE